MRRLVQVIVMLQFTSICCFAQSSAVDEYMRFSRQAIARHNDFRVECNSKYVEFLKNAWTYYHTSPGFQKPEEKDIPPVIIKDKEVTPIKDNQISYDEVIPIVESEPQPQPIQPIESGPDVSGEWFEFAFFNTMLKVRADESHKFKIESLDGQGLSRVWELLMTEKYNNMLVDCLKIRDQHKLCDWAYLLMLLNFSGEFLQSENEMMLLTSYLFSQSGYKMRIGLDDKGLTMLFGTEHQIYNRPYICIDGVYFYSLNNSDEQINIVDFAFPNERNLSLKVDHEPILDRKESERRSYSSVRYSVNVLAPHNANLLSFLETYPSSQLNNNPLTRWAMYANTPLDSYIKQELYPVLKDAMNGMSSSEAADLLLDFVQTAFEYEYDDKVWGGDRAFFAEESLYYPYCDCEDRSILYSRLVRDLLGLNVILVYYPGHLATAVEFKEYVPGDYITLDSRRYLVCDPTYIGATIGMTMPEMDNTSAKVILLQK